MENIIEINHLYKSFGAVKAVQDLSFRVKEGELFAFLGVNGAGKSTTISILCGQQTRDSGSVEIGGKSLDGNLDAIKRKLGVAFQNSVLDKPLTVWDNLQSRAALYGITGEDFENRLAVLCAPAGFWGFAEPHGGQALRRAAAAHRHRARPVPPPEHPDSRRADHRP